MAGEAKQRRTASRGEKGGSDGSGGKVVKAVVSELAAILMLASVVYSQDVTSFCHKRVAAVGIRQEGKSGTCRFRDNKKSGWNELRTTDTARKQFRAGQHLCCDKGRKIVILLCGTGEEYPVKKNLPQWYRVLNVYASPRWLKDSKLGIPARSSKLWIPENPNPLHLNPQLAVSSQIPTSASPRRDDELQIDRRNDPTSSSAIARAMTNQSLGRNKRGRESSFNALLDKANVARNTKNYMAAQQYYEEALKQRPADSRPLYGLGNLYFDQTKWEQAEEAYRRALQVDSPEPETYTALGLVLLQPREGVVTVDRLREAEASLWEAYELTPRDEKAYELLTSVLDMRRSSLEEAERVHRKAVLLNPLSAKAHLRLSEVLRKIGRTSEANKYLERSDELASNVTELFAVAETWETQGRYGKAEGALRRATKLSPLDPQLMSSLGRLLLLQKHPGEAAQLLKRSVATSPEGFAPYYLLGLALLQTQNWSEAELAFDKAAMKASRGSDEWLAVAYGIAAVGDAHAKFDRLSEAIRLYEKALQYDPEDQETKDKLSEARGVLKP